MCYRNRPNTLASDTQKEGGSMMVSDAGALPLGGRQAGGDHAGRSLPCNDHDVPRHDPGANKTLLVDLFPDASTGPIARTDALGAGAWPAQPFIGG